MFRKLIASQFKKPKGLLGIFTSNMMIKGNKKNYDVLLNDLDIRPDDKLLEIGELTLNKKYNKSFPN